MVGKQRLHLLLSISASLTVRAAGIPSGNASLKPPNQWATNAGIEPKNHGDLIQRKINGDFMISDWIFAFSLQPGWRLTRNPMAVHGLFMKQVMAVENPWNIYLQTLGNQFVEYESVLADHSIPAHACTCTNSFGSIPSPKCWLFSFLATNLPETHILWPSERIFIFDLLIRASEKQTYSLYSPVLVDFPLGRSNITLNKPRQGTHDIEKNASCGVFCRTIRKGEGICERHLARLGGFPSWSDCQRVHG